MIGGARGCSRARKRVARRKGFLDRFVERVLGLRTSLAPRPLPGLPHAKSFLAPGWQKRRGLGCAPAMMVAPGKSASSRSLRLMPAALRSIPSISFI